MRLVLFLSVFVIGLFAAGCLTQQAEGQKSGPAAASAPTQSRVPVVVELFTSEGCSSCPPADRALKFLSEQQPVSTAEIIPLAFHVDYWDNLGWKDKFSSAVYSRRQELYVSRFGLTSSYTPEMVVDGQSEFVGNDTGKASKKISEAASDQKGDVLLSVKGDTVSVSVSGLPEHHPSTVFLAISEDGITSIVKGGENGGQTFNHSSVVRSLTTVGLVEKDNNSFESKTSIPVIADLKPENSRLVVFVQDNTSRKIIAAEAITRRN
jgi:hypothetical protein